MNGNVEHIMTSLAETTEKPKIITFVADKIMYPSISTPYQMKPEVSPLRYGFTACVESADAIPSEIADLFSEDHEFGDHRVKLSSRSPIPFFANGPVEAMMRRNIPERMFFGGERAVVVCYRFEASAPLGNQKRSVLRAVGIKFIDPISDISFGEFLTMVQR